MRSRHSFRLMALLCFPLAMAAQVPAPEQPRQSTSRGTAELIGVLPELRKLEEISTSAAPVDKWQILWLHQHISEEVLTASLQVDATIAQIDNEIARANELRGYLADRRDRTVSRANLLSTIVGGVVGATGSGLGFDSSLSKPAAAVGVGVGSVSAGLALFGIHAQAGKSSPFDFPSNMLAEFFDRPALANSRYPATIRTFLNEESVNGSPGTTRRQELLQSWVRVRRIDSLASTEKIDHLTSEPSQMLRLSIDDLEDRAAMLEDVRARISDLKRDLGALLSSLPAVAEAP